MLATNCPKRQSGNRTLSSASTSSTSSREVFFCFAGSRTFVSSKQPPNLRQQCGWHGNNSFRSPSPDRGGFVGCQLSGRPSAYPVRPANFFDAARPNRPGISVRSSLPSPLSPPKCLELFAFERVGRHEKHNRRQVRRGHKSLAGSVHFPFARAAWRESARASLCLSPGWANIHSTSDSVTPWSEMGAAHQTWVAIIPNGVHRRTLVVLGWKELYHERAEENTFDLPICHADRRTRSSSKCGTVSNACASAAMLSPSCAISASLMRPSFFMWPSTR